MRAHRYLSSLGLSGLVLMGLGCAGDTTGPLPTAPAAVSALGSGQSGMAGETLADPIGVKVTDEHGNPVQGVAVSFTVTAGGGSLGAASVVTDEQGVAVTTWTVSTTVRIGYENSVTATFADYPNLQCRLYANSLPGPAAALEMVSGNGQSTFTGFALPSRLVVRVVDAYDNPVPGATVNWAVTAGGGAVSASSSATDVAGLASVVWTLGAISGAGSQGLIATVEGLSASSAVSFAASALPTPLVLVKVSGDMQAATWGMPLAAPFVIRVVDASGRPVPGLVVSWSDRQDWMGGSRLLSRDTTDASGESSATLTLDAQDFWGPADSVRVASVTVDDWGAVFSLYTTFYVVNR